jgi:hypothetical protein
MPLSTKATKATSNIKVENTLLLEAWLLLGNCGKPVLLGPAPTPALVFDSSGGAVEVVALVVLLLTPLVAAVSVPAVAEAWGAIGAVSIGSAA